MFSRINDPDVQLLASTASRLKGDYDDENAENIWRESPFGWIRERPSRQVGKIGEQLIAGYFAAKGLDVSKCPDSEADRVIGGHRVEIKFSTLWQNGTYRFQQIRDQNYSHLVCLGISPFTAHCWIVPKQTIRKYATGQHTGHAASDTMWLKVDPANVPAWLKRFGGTLAQAFSVLGTE